MQRDNPAGALVTLLCLTVFAAVFVIYTTRYLPDTVATHFGADNQANGWMSRNGYRFFILSFMIGISAFVSFVVGTLPRKFPQWTNVPNRDYWLAPARREESLRYLSAHGKRLGCLIIMMMLGMHYVILSQFHKTADAAGADFFGGSFRLRSRAHLVDCAAVPPVSETEGLR